MPHTTVADFLARAAELFADRRRPRVTINDRTPLDGTTWVRADAAGDDKPPKPRGLFRGQRREIDPKEWTAAILPSELFDMLPTVEAHQNWILYPLERGRPCALEALQIACEYYGRRAADRTALIAKNPDASSQPAPPIDMLLYCPNCGAQHVDKPEPDRGWDNRPHRSHLCRHCGLVWRPADVATNGVPAIRTRGTNDTDPSDARRNPKDAFFAEFERRAAEGRAAYDSESRRSRWNSLLILLGVGVYCAGLAALIARLSK